MSDHITYDEATGLYVDHNLQVAFDAEGDIVQYNPDDGQFYYTGDNVYGPADPTEHAVEQFVAEQLDAAQEYLNHTGRTDITPEEIVTYQLERSTDDHLAEPHEAAHAMSNEREFMKWYRDHPTPANEAPDLITDYKRHQAGMRDRPRTSMDAGMADFMVELKAGRDAEHGAPPPQAERLQALANELADELGR